MTFSTETNSCEEGRPVCCVDHGPDCHDESHAHVTLEWWRATQGLCGNCGKPGDIKWGDPLRAHVLRCRRCSLTEQLAHARERAAAIPQLEAELAAEGRVGAYEGSAR